MAPGSSPLVPGGRALQRPHVAGGESAGRRGGVSVETSRWGGGDFGLLVREEGRETPSPSASPLTARGKVPGATVGSCSRELR